MLQRPKLISMDDVKLCGWKNFQLQHWDTNRMSIFLLAAAALLL